MQYTSSHQPVRHHTAFAVCLAWAAITASGASAYAATANADIVWMNVRDLPASLTIAADTWHLSAIRSEPPHFSSPRIAADAFLLDAEPTITRIPCESWHAC